MKRFQFLTGFLCGALLFCAFPTVASAASNIMAAISNQPVYVDGQRVYMTAYQIGGNNYVKLRDIGEAVGFNVYWDGASVQVESDKPYTGAAPVDQPAQQVPAALTELTEENVNRARLTPLTLRRMFRTIPLTAPTATATNVLAGLCSAPMPLLATCPGGE